MWRFTRSLAGAGRLRRSPGTPGGIAKQDKSENCGERLTGGQGRP